MCFLITHYKDHGSSPPPNFSGGPKNFRPKLLGGGPKQKIKFGGELNLRGDLKFYGGPMNPNDVMAVVLKDILLC